MDTITVVTMVTMVTIAVVTMVTMLTIAVVTMFTMSTFTMANITMVTTTIVDNLCCTRLTLHFTFSQSWLKGLIEFENFKWAGGDRPVDGWRTS